MSAGRQATSSPQHGTKSRAGTHKVAMKTVAVLLLLCVAATAGPAPSWFYNRGGQASGGANANVVSATQNGFGGSSAINSVSAGAYGSTSGGGSSYSSGSASLTSGSGIFGGFSNANTNAQSNQFTRRRYFG
ncbi:DEAD-box ATP-dependent RNA helicase 9, mitochondrial-like [Pollicipes pollicipes]|uniref:DEAD-box ATP-dependent RNA helicase 9, mitochondrial-like n=1 Tax=Pollicipes pollicipes TaxID=41117 RepID=UPI0018852543|nr:DEAD-box ATP-dependent RNA helicase 9, mitochondrial-like [Pollicipes pollicipes]